MRACESGRWFRSSPTPRIAPFWLIPFTVLVSVLTESENDTARLQWWIGASIVATILLTAGT